VKLAHAADDHLPRLGVLAKTDPEPRAVMPVLHLAAMVGVLLLAKRRVQ